MIGLQNLQTNRMKYGARKSYSIEVYFEIFIKKIQQ